MNKSQRCLLHVRCLMVKSIQGRSTDWHWQHILREFGCGEYSDRKKRLKRGAVE